MGVGERLLQIRRRLLDQLVSKLETSHRLQCSGRRRIPWLLLIHGFVIDATFKVFGNNEAGA